MSKSIMQNNKVCYKTGSTYNLHKHHIYGGANRNHSEHYGFWVYLTADYHNMSNKGVHFDINFDRELKAECQRKFEETHTRQEFMSIIGKNYILDGLETDFFVVDELATASKCDGHKKPLADNTEDCKDCDIYKAMQCATNIIVGADNLIIKLAWIAKIQAATIRRFEEEDTDAEYVNRRAVAGCNRTIENYLNKITPDKSEQSKILEIIERENWNTTDVMFKPICDKLRSAGYEVVNDRT